MMPAGVLPLTEALDTTLSCVCWGTEGTGKTLFAIKTWPTPVLVLNLDRGLTVAHLNAVNSRADQIFVKNLREDLMAIDHLEGLRVRDEVERTIMESLDWLKGGTVVLDGGTMYRAILQMTSQNIAKAISEGKKWNPKEKEQVNAYYGAFISRVADKGINLVITAHAAWKWEMQESEGGRKSLTKTTRLYPKLDDIAHERTATSVLLLKTCQCGRKVTNEDGTCAFQGLPGSGEHTGRRHVGRIVSNKYNTATEGTEWENLDYNMLRILCFDPDLAETLMKAKAG